MSTSSNELKIEGNKVRSPLTGRLITVGSPTYKKLIRDKLIDDRAYSINQILYQGENCHQVLEGMNKNLIPRGKTAYVKDNKIQTRDKRTNKQLVSVKSREMAELVYKTRPQDFVGKTPEEIKEMIERYILEDLLQDKNPTVKTQEIKQQFEYVVEHIGTDDESEDSSEFETVEEEYSDWESQTSSMVGSTTDYTSEVTDSNISEFMTTDQSESDLASIAE